MELFAMGATLQRWSFSTSQLTIYYVDSRQDNQFSFLSKLMFHLVDNKEIISLV